MNAHDNFKAVSSWTVTMAFWSYLSFSISRFNGAFLSLMLHSLLENMTDYINLLISYCLLSLKRQQSYPIPHRQGLCQPRSARQPEHVWRHVCKRLLSSPDITLSFVHHPTFAHSCQYHFQYQCHQWGNVTQAIQCNRRCYTARKWPPGDAVL